MRARVYISVFLFLFFSRVSFGQQLPEAILQPYIVTATRTPISAEHLTTSVSVITSDDIRQQQSRTVADALRNVPGLDVTQLGSRGASTELYIRGAEPDQVLVLIDGVEANSSTTGRFNFAHLTTENIDRIEVLRGSGGTLYGSQAIGGVIHIITKNGQGSPEATISTEGGNGYSHGQIFNTRGGLGKLGYFLSASRFETAGFNAFNDDYRNLATSSRLDYQINENSVLKGIFHFRKTHVGLFNNNNFIGIPDPNAREEVTDYTGRIDWEQSLLPGWDYRIGGSIFKQHDKFSDDPEPGSFDVRRRNRFRPLVLGAEFQTNYRWARFGVTTLGIEYKRRQAKTDAIDEEQGSSGYYLQQQLEVLDNRLLFVSGIRLDDHEVFGRELSPSVSAAYTLPITATKFLAGYSEGFKAPTLNQLFFPGFGNKSLGPEKSWEINVGLEQPLADKLWVGVTYFHRDIKDLIQFVPPSFRAQNVGDVRVNGIETSGHVRVGKPLFFRAAYTFLTSESSTGALLRRPRHRGSLQLNYEWDGFQANLDTNIVGKRDDVGVQSGATVKEAGYVTLNLASSYVLTWQPALTKSISVFGKIENLLNRKYEEADGFRARPFNLLLGLRATFGNTR